MPAISAAKMIQIRRWVSSNGAWSAGAARVAVVVLIRSVRGWVRMVGEDVVRGR